MTMMRTKINQKGFSLLELLIAIVILTTGLLAVATMQATAIGANGIANRNATITSLAQEVYEDIMSWSNGNPDPRLTVDTVNAIYDLDPLTAGSAFTVPSVGAFNARYSITTGAPVAGMATIVVTVTGGNRSVTLTGYRMNVPWGT